MPFREHFPFFWVPEGSPAGDSRPGFPGICGRTRPLGLNLLWVPHAAEFQPGYLKAVWRDFSFVTIWS